MAVTYASTYTGPARFHGDTADTDHPHYPEVLKHNDAMSTNIQTALTAGFGANTGTLAALETLVGTTFKAQVRVPVVAAQATKRKEFILPTTASASVYAHWNPPVGVTITGYKFARGNTAAGTATIALDRITKSTGAVESALSTAVDVAAGTNDVEQTFTPSGAVPHTLTSAQGLKITLAAGAGAGPPATAFIIEYTETSAVSGKGQATWFPGRAMTVTGITACLTETFVGATLVANLSDVVATTGVLVPLGTSQSLAALVQDVETAYVPDEAAGALPYALTALKGLRFEVVADATTKAPDEVTFTITYTHT